MVLSLTIIKVTLLMTLSGVRSEDIERLSDASTSKAIGENVTMVWNVTGITASFNNVLVIFISKGKLSSISIVFHFTVVTNVANFLPKAAVGDLSAYKKLASRSTAKYTYTGKSSARQETARVSFTITNLILSDEGSYILRARASSLSINLLVNFGPERCGIGLKSEYIVNKENHLMITSGFCGKPQPTVACTINGRPLNNIVISEVSQYNYTYIVDIPKLEPCDRKELHCTVTGYGKSFTDSAIVRREFTSNVASLIKNITFIRECDNCSTVSWRKEDSTGKCDVHHQLQFLNATNATTTYVYLKGNSYSNCSLQFESVRVTTSVYGTLNGTYKLLDKRTSNIVQLFYKSCTITTTTADIDALLSKLNEKNEEVHSKSILIIVLGVVTALFVILTILLIVLVKIGKKKIESFQKNKAGNVNQECQENVKDANTVMKPTSDYMELQAARKDTTYQALTSVQSAPDAGKDNSAYKENIQVKVPSNYMELQAARKDTTYQALTSIQSAPGPTKDNSIYEVSFDCH